MLAVGWCTVLLHLTAYVVLVTCAEVSLNKDLDESRAGHVKICDEKFAAISTLHTACLQSPRRAHEGMSQATKDVVLGIHNYYREKVGKGDGQYPATDMQIMGWDNELAELAQRWASNCLYSHDHHKNRVIPGRFYVGQNIAWTSLYDWKFTLEAWHEEHKYFRYGMGATKPGAVIGHYTQGTRGESPNTCGYTPPAGCSGILMVWASSTKLGCGYAFCNGTRHFYVCNYGPIANVELPNDRNAMFRPYRIGRSLSACPYNRRDGLCDCRGKVCLNGGTLDVSTCTCRCVNTPWIDKNNDCALRCEAARNARMCTNKVWGPEYCMKFINVPYQYCPIMCNWCPARVSKKLPHADHRRTRLGSRRDRGRPGSRHHSHARHNTNGNPNPHRKSKSKSKAFGENELPLGDQPHVSVNSTTTSTTTIVETTTSPYIASTTTTLRTSTNRPVTGTPPPTCMKAERSMCGQPHSKGFYPPKFCTHAMVRLTCPAMCGSCSASECVDYDGHRFQPGSSWLTAYGRVDCTSGGAIFTSGCVKDATSPNGMFVHIGGKGVYRKGDYQYTCACSRVGRKKKLSCISKWVGSHR